VAVRTLKQVGEVRREEGGKLEKGGSGGISCSELAWCARCIVRRAGRSRRQKKQTRPGGRDLNEGRPGRGETSTFS